MTKFQDKKRYIVQILKGKSHRQIAKVSGWSVSASIIRDELIRDGVIIQTKIVLDNLTRKNHVYFELSGKDITQEFEAEFWSCGTPKSRNNVFDWRNKEQCIFTKAEIAQLQQKQKGNRPITIYSRA